MFRLKDSVFSIYRYIFLLIGFSIITYGQALPKVNHQVTKAEAIKYIDNFKISPAATVINIKGGAFNRDIVDKILAQSGCAGIRLYYGKLDDGSSTMVMVGVDSIGNDLSEGTIAEAIIPCPPRCDGSVNSLLK